jgi:hypothetical protein
VSPPWPPPDFNSRRPKLIKLPVGKIANRFYAPPLPPIHFDRSAMGRLNSQDGSYGVLYAAASERGAFAETFLRSPGRRLIDPGLMARKGFVHLRFNRPMALVELHGPGLAVLGATAEVVHGPLPYDLAQAWSQVIHSHPLTPDGIAYMARHDDAELCYALFDRASATVEEADRITDLETDWFWRLAEVYGMGRPP